MSDSREHDDELVLEWMNDHPKWEVALGAERLMPKPGPLFTAADGTEVWEVLPEEAWEPCPVVCLHERCNAYHEESTT